MTRTRRSVAALLTALTLTASGMFVASAGAGTVDASWSHCCGLSP